MSFNNIKLIFGREMRDQLRDRRTLFMIAVLPLLFYPLLGFSFFKIAQFLKGDRKILVVGYKEVAGLPQLFDRDNKFVEGLLGDRHRAGALQVEMKDMPRDEAVKKVKDGTYEVAIYFPPEFWEDMEKYRAAKIDKAPTPELITDESKETSAMAGNLTSSAMRSWSEEVETQILNESSTRPTSARNPVQVRQISVSAPEKKFEPSLWSKILPFVLLIWAVTGAFYPAVDLCAGEKERGTLETLLTSPAQRSEIVYGKLLTVMVFSSVTAILNLVCMGVTGGVVMSQLGALPAIANVGPPPFSALGWLVLLLLPVSALYSAVCLALAAFARSTKEGQYYLMPVILITMPLILVPMDPGVELNFGTSLIPVSGIVLLMRSTMEGTIGHLWPFAIPVIAVTLGCCWLAVRWAVDQFSSESVLFREGERWDLGSWLKHLVRDRQPTPSVGMAAMCGVLIMVLTFFFQFLATPGGIPELAFVFKSTIIMGVAVVATPALIMAIILTRSPGRTLLLPVSPDLRTFAALPAAALLAILLFPAVVTFGIAVESVYPLRSPELKAFVQRVAAIEPGSQLFWLGWVAIALTPALCEELAFRGFILSGLRHQGHKWRAIIFSAVMFGVTHGILQQSINATLLGCVLGYLAVQSGNLWTGVIYHMTHNTLVYLLGLSAFDLQDSWLSWLQMPVEDGHVFHPAVIIVTLLGAAAILYWFSRFSYRRTSEEAFQERIDHESAHAMAR